MAQNNHVNKNYSQGICIHGFGPCLGKMPFFLQPNIKIIVFARLNSRLEEKQNLYSLFKQGCHMYKPNIVGER